MALNRPIISTKAGTTTSVVLGYDKIPNSTTYHATFELNMPKKIICRQRRFQLPPSEIFHRTERKCPLTVHQASFGDTPSFLTNQVYQQRKCELKNIMGIHLLKSVPIGPRQPSDSLHSYVTNTSQMRTDYMDRHHALHDWTKVQQPGLPKLPPIKNAPCKQGHLRWYGHKTEAAYQFQWPGKDGSNINQVKFRIIK
ncbi:uncharacterized protein LOC120327156 [Styela clava]|uniref:uncharacterized protein LOC120326910 n=1 Tax=Styela clava TaxID=7725 RepID=UPI00193ABC09|nr:uncharacterized protein LOC120326910 [Styela clava]XP_039249516.1 uncharacterized protein LOC120327156 [Styela clava]